MVVIRNGVERVGRRRGLHCREERACCLTDEGGRGRGRKEGRNVVGRREDEDDLGEDAFSGG